MRRTSLAIAMVAAIAASYGLGWYVSHSQTDSKSGRHILYYVDPMHPSYKSDKPGIAPDCGMKLVPVYADEIGNAISPLSAAQFAPGTVSIDAATQRLLGIQVAAAAKTDAMGTAHVAGRVAPEDTRVYMVNSGVDGFIRETFNDSVGNYVKKDQKLAAYYSPDFLATASGFLAATERIPGSSGKDGARLTPNWGGTIAKEGLRSIQGYADHLRSYGMSDVQMNHIAETRELPDSIDVVAPADGFVIERNITAGQHFDHMMEFYRIADLSRVWIVAEVSELQAANLHPGDMAQVELKEEGRRLQARVTDSLPRSEAGGGTVKLRLEADNPKFLLRPDMLVDVELPVRMQPGVTVPVDALIDSGARSRVYVERSEGIFEPREVETGWRTDRQVEILNGVKPGERVVVTATFLVDSESRLRAPGSAPAPSAAPSKPAGMTSGHMTAQKKPVKDTVSAGKHQGDD